MQLVCASSCARAEGEKCTHPSRVLASTTIIRDRHLTLEIYWTIQCECGLRPSASVIILGLFKTRNRHTTSHVLAAATHKSKYTFLITTFLLIFDIFVNPTPYTTFTRDSRAAAATTPLAFSLTCAKGIISAISGAVLYSVSCACFFYFFE